MTIRSRIFSPSEIRYIERTYRDYPIGETARRFNAHFGTAHPVQRFRSFVHNHGINCGRTGQFSKGNAPWNTGTKGATGRNRTSFKKGQEPATTKPLGHERICQKDGYVLVKVAEPNPWTGCQTRYKAKHQVVWERAHGPLPKGYCIRFINGNQKDCRLQNLVLVSRRVNALLNKKYKYGEVPGHMKPTIMLAAMLEGKAGALQVQKIKRQRSKHWIRKPTEA